MHPDDWDRRSRGDSPFQPPGPSARESTSGVLVLLALLVLAAAIAYHRYWDARQQSPPPQPPAPQVVGAGPVS